VSEEDDVEDCRDEQERGEDPLHLASHRARQLIAARWRSAKRGLDAAETAVSLLSREW
jgi:hypothetical protein